LLLASVKGGRIMSRIWVAVHMLIMLAIGGSCLCILTNEIEITKQLEIFLITTGADFFFLIYFCWVVFSYSYNLNGDVSGKNDKASAARYHVPPGNMNANNANGNSNGGVKVFPMENNGKSMIV